MRREPKQNYTDDQLYAISTNVHPLPWSYRWASNSHVPGGGRFVLVDANGKQVTGRSAMIRICRDVNKINAMPLPKPTLELPPFVTIIDDDDESADDWD